MATQPLSYYIRLEALLRVVDWGSQKVPISGTSSVFPDTEALRHIPGAPRRGRVMLQGPSIKSSTPLMGPASVISFVVFPFADFLLSLLRGFGCHVCFFTPDVSFGVATELISAAGWSTFPVISVLDVLPQSHSGSRRGGGSSGRVVLNTAHLGISTTNWNSFVIVDVDHTRGSSPSPYSWSSSLVPYVLCVNHAQGVPSGDFRGGGRGVDADDLAKTSFGKRQQSFQRSHQEGGAAAQHADVTRKAVRASLTSLGLLYMLHKALRIFELFTSGVASDHRGCGLPAFGDVRNAIHLSESSLFSGVTFDVVSSLSKKKDEKLVAKSSRGTPAAAQQTQRGDVTFEATQFALWIREHGATVVALQSIDDVLDVNRSENDEQSGHDNRILLPRLCHHYRVVVTSATTDSSDDDDDERSDTRAVATSSTSPVMMTNEHWVSACVDAWCLLPCHSTVSFTVASLDELAELNADQDEVEGDLPDQRADLGENIGLNNQRQLTESTFCYAHHKKLHEYLVAHMMLLLAPPADCVSNDGPASDGTATAAAAQMSSSLPAFSRHVLHAILAECHLSSAPLDDNSFVKMMSQELGFTTCTSPNTSRNAIKHEEGGEDIDRNEMVGSTAQHSNAIFEGFYSKRRSAAGGFTTSSSGSVVGGPIAVVSETDMAVAHAKRIKEALAYEISKSISRPARQEAATQTWVVRKASTKTMTDPLKPSTIEAAAANNNVTSSTVVALVDKSVGVESRYGHRQEVSQGERLVAASNTDAQPSVWQDGQREGRVVDRHSPRSDALPSRSSAFQPTARKGSPSDEDYHQRELGPRGVSGSGEEAAGRCDPQHDRNSTRKAYASANSFIVPLSAGNVAGLPLYQQQQQHPQPPSTTMQRSSDSALPQQPLQQQQPDHRTDGMVPLLNATPAGTLGYAITGDFLPDFMTVELPLYAYGLQMDPKTPNKALKALLAVDNKRMLDGVNLQLLPAPEWFIRNAPRAASTLAGWFTLLLSFSSESEARLFAAETWFATLTGKSKKVVKLLEGEQLAPVASPAVVSTTHASSNHDVSVSAAGERLRQRSGSPAHQRSKRGRSPTNNNNNNNISRLAANPITALTAQLTDDEITVIGNVGSSVSQLYDDPRKLEQHCHQHLGGFPREQQLILSAVRKALSMQLQPPPPPPPLHSTHHRR
jgi:hypothetical protein